MKKDQSPLDAIDFYSWVPKQNIRNNGTQDQFWDKLKHPHSSIIHTHTHNKSPTITTINWHWVPRQIHL